MVAFPFNKLIIHKQNGNKNYLRVDNGSWTTACQKMTYSAFKLYLFFASYTDEYKVQVRAKDAELLGVSRAAFYRAICELQYLGYISVNPGSDDADFYVDLVDAKEQNSTNVNDESHCNDSQFASNNLQKCLTDETKMRSRCLIDETKQTQNCLIHETKNSKNCLTGETKINENCLIDETKNDKKCLMDETKCLTGETKKDDFDEKSVSRMRQNCLIDETKCLIDETKCLTGETHIDKMTDKDKNNRGAPCGVLASTDVDVPTGVGLFASQNFSDNDNCLPTNLEGQQSSQKVTDQKIDDAEITGDNFSHSLQCGKSTNQNSDQDQNVQDNKNENVVNQNDSVVDKKEDIIQDNDKTNDKTDLHSVKKKSTKKTELQSTSKTDLKSITLDLHIALKELEKYKQYNTGLVQAIMVYEATGDKIDPIRLVKNLVSTDVERDKKNKYRFVKNEDNIKMFMWIIGEE